MFNRTDQQKRRLEKFVSHSSGFPSKPTRATMKLQWGRPVLRIFARILQKHSLFCISCSGGKQQAPAWSWQWTFRCVGGSAGWWHGLPTGQALRRATQRTTLALFCQRPIPKSKLHEKDRYKSPKNNTKWNKYKNKYNNSSQSHMSNDTPPRITEDDWDPQKILPTQKNRQNKKNSKKKEWKTSL